MKVINNQQEFEQFLADIYPENAYDVDLHWVLNEMEYTFPVLLIFQGHTHLGAGYKAYSKDDVKTLKEFVWEE